jgi:23S rRNA (cytosine1962-C5)-methyltransferase
MFLDQREMRQLVKNYSKDRTVLNCFSYSGGFSIYALAGQALQADSVDSDKNAISSAKNNLLLNGFDVNKNGLYASDVMAFLGQSKLPANYDFIILDPPAFAKRASDVKNASRGYRDLNRLAMQKLPKGGLLLTSSCSSHIDKDLFKTIIFQAAKDAKRNIKILSYHVLAADHHQTKHQFRLRLQFKFHQEPSTLHLHLHLLLYLPTFLRLPCQL